MFFRNNIEVSDYNCDSSGRMKLSAALKKMEDVSAAQMRDAGFPLEKMYAEGITFFLTKLCMRVHRMPICGEEITIGTTPTPPQKTRFPREYVVESKGGERLISTLMFSVLVDPSSRKIIRPSQFPYNLEYDTPILDGIIEDIKIPEAAPTGERVIKEQIRYSHLDINGHVNNTVYADFACDVLPHSMILNRVPEVLAIHFQNEAKIDENLEISCRKVAEEYETYTIRGTVDSGKCFGAMVRFK